MKSKHIETGSKALSSISLAVKAGRGLQILCRKRARTVNESRYEKGTIKDSSYREGDGKEKSLPCKALILKVLYTDR